MFEAPSKEPVPYGFDEEDHHFTNEETAIPSVNIIEVEVQRHVGQHIDGNGGQEHLLPSFQQKPQHTQLNENGGHQCYRQFCYHLRLSWNYKVANKYPGTSAAANKPNANPSFPLSKVFAQ